jgi:transcriptional regulator with XRE-family HTH domain
VGLGEALREARKEAGVTQFDLGVQVANLLGRTDSFDQASVSAWELGRAQMTVEQMLACEQALGLVPGELLRQTGYLKPAKKLEQMIEQEPGLTKEARATLAATLRALRGLNRP